MPDFPTNPNPAPPNGAPSTLPDAVNASSNPWVAIISAVTATPNTAANSLTLNFTVIGAGTTVYAGIWPVGDKPPTHDEIVAGTGAIDSGSALLTDGVGADVILSAAGDRSYAAYYTFTRAATRNADTYFAGWYSSLGPEEVPYESWGTGVQVSPTMPANISDFIDGNSTIAVSPVTVIAQQV